MKYMTLKSAERLTGLANMLEILGHDTEDHLIAKGMEAPYLFVRDNTGYRAGSKLYRPEWLNLYLIPRGFRMEEKLVPPSEACGYLRANSPAMLLLNVGKGVARPVVCTGYSDGKYTFINIKPQIAPDADTFTLTAPTLKRRLTEAIVISTLQPCTPESVDLLTPMMQSLVALDAYSVDVIKLFQHSISQHEFMHIRENLLRPLMQDLLPLTPFTDDFILAEELRLLNHDYRHIFPCNERGDVMLSTQLPRNSIRKCITWLQEDILDRLHALGATDEMIDAFMHNNAK